mgnify:CR=1 FL=1
MSFNQTVIDVSVYQGEIDWPRVKAAGIYAAVLRAGYGMYAHQKDARFEEYYAGARAAGLPVGAYWFSYAKTAAEARREARVCLEILAGRALQMPLYFDQEESGIPAAVRTACALAFLGYIRANSRYKAGYYTYTAYFPSVELAAIQAHCDTIWLADYRQNYDKTIPRDMHQYTSSGSVPGILGRVDMNHLYRDFPNEKEDEPMYKSDTLKVGPASAGDLKTMRTLAESLIVPVQQEGDLLIIGPMSAGDRTAISNKALALGLGCEDYEAPEEPEEKPDGPEELDEVLAAVTSLGAKLDKLAACQEEQTDILKKLLAQQQAAGAALSGEDKA